MAACSQPTIGGRHTAGPGRDRSTRGDGAGRRGRTRARARRSSPYSSGDHAPEYRLRLALYHFADPVVEVAEMARITRGSGTLAIGDLLSPDDTELADRYNQFERMRDPSHTHAVTGDELRDLLDVVGRSVGHWSVREVEVDLVPWFDLTRSPVSTRKTISEALRRELGRRAGHRDAAAPTPRAAVVPADVGLRAIRPRRSTGSSVTSRPVRSDSAACRAVMPSVLHCTDQYANNRAEVSHQPTRQRERQMRRFTSAAQLQRSRRFTRSRAESLPSRSTPLAVGSPPSAPHPRVR